MNLTFRRLKWGSVVAPIVATASFFLLTEVAFPDFAHGWAGFTLLTLAACVAIVAFGFIIFEQVSRLQKRILGQNAQLELMARLSSALSEAGPIEGIFQKMLDDILDSQSIEAGFICLLEADRDELYSSAHRGLQPGMIEMIRRAKVSDRAIGSAVIRSAKPVVIDDATEDPRTAGLAAEYGFRSLASVPLLLDGRVRGIVGFISPRQSLFTQDHLLLFLQIGPQIALAAARSQLMNDLFGRTEQLSQLNRVSTALSKTLDVDEVMTIALESAMGVSEGRFGELWLSDGAKESPALRQVRHGVGAGNEDDSTDLQCAPLRQEATQTGRPQFRFEGGFGIGCLPLRSGGETIGAICIHGVDEHGGQGELCRLLESVVEQSGVALSNAQLHGRVKEVAVIEERERIAREMHDGLGQILGYVNTKAFAIRRMLSVGEIESAQEMIGQLEEAAREISTEVREGVLALRSSSPNAGDLIDDISEYAEKYERQTGIHVECLADQRSMEVRLPEKTAIQVSRVLQEALSNVRKHAGAASVTVRLKAQEATLRIEIADDGCGFDLAQIRNASEDRFGLKTMHERIEAVGGQFHVTTAPGRGTTISVDLPHTVPVKELVRP